MTLLIFALLFLPAFIFDFFYKSKQALTLKDSIFWSVFWILFSLAFGLVVLFLEGRQAATEYWTAYIIEKSLSVDNLFVFCIIFQQFGLKIGEQQKALWFGIFGAIVFRVILLTGGTLLLQSASYLIYPLAGLLLLLAYKILFSTSESEPKGIAFSKKLGLSPFWASILVIELNDLIFAADSIPAVLAISSNPIVLITSNIAAIQSLRCLYFLLAALKDKLQYLSVSIGIILLLIGAKMIVIRACADLFGWVLHVNSLLWLCIISTILGIGIITSLIKNRDTLVSEDLGG